MALCNSSRPLVYARGSVRRSEPRPSGSVGTNPMALSPPRVFLSEQQIQQRIRAMGEQITNDYPQGPIYLVAILKGAFMFLADLARAIRTPTRIEFIGISSYGTAQTSSGVVTVTKVLYVSIERH